MLIADVAGNFLFKGKCKKMVQKIYTEENDADMMLPILWSLFVCLVCLSFFGEKRERYRLPEKRTPAKQEICYSDDDEIDAD